MKARVFRKGRALRRTRSTIAAVLGLVLALGVVQINVVKWDVDPRRMLPVALGVFVLLILGYVAVLEIYLPFVRSRHALKELQRHVSMATLLTHYRSRPHGIGNPVVLSRLSCNVITLPGDFPKSLKYTWELRGTNTSDSPIAALELSIAGDSAVAFSALVARSRTEWGGGSLTAEPLVTLEKETVKRVRLPFIGDGPDTGELFECYLDYVWPRVLNPTCDYMFIETSNFGHTVNSIDLSFTAEVGDYSHIHLFEVDVVSSSSRFLGSEESHEGQRMRARIEKPSKDCIYVILLKP